MKNSSSPKSKKLLFIVDMQNDFCLPDGKLSVPEAMSDAERLAEFIRRKSNDIDAIYLTQDSHQVADIAHPSFWIDAEGNYPPVFTPIQPADIKSNKWKTKNPEHQDWADFYIRELETQNEFTHVIWPEHCISGSYGEAIVQPVMEAVEDWAREGRFYDIIRKGTNPYTEHFGAFKANVIVTGASETALNKELIDRLKDFDEIFLAGEAKSHCVATTVKQLLDYKEIVPKLIILEDCMSDVAGFENFAQTIYDQAVTMGAKKIKSSAI